MLDRTGGQIEPKPSSDKTLEMAQRPDFRLRRLASPPFVLGAAMLAAGAILAGPVASAFNYKRFKEPLPLKARLDALDESRLGPYRVVSRAQLDPTHAEALGTDQYITWLLEDTRVPENEPLRYAHLHISYYTGGSNLVPHTPDVCMLGHGYEPTQSHEYKDIVLDKTVGGGAELPIRVCTFGKTAVFNREEMSVIYTFNCNGTFTNRRDGVRLRVNAPANTYAYFSKIEVSFPGASRAQSIEGAQKLFSVVLPVLMEQHWPDFAAAEAAAKQDSAKVE